MIFDATVGRYRGSGRHFLPLGPTKLVCASCGELWRGPGNPASCPDCGKASYAISVLRNKKAKRRVKRGVSKGKSNSR